MALVPTRPGDDDALMHEQERRLVEGAGPGAPARRALASEHQLAFLQRTAGNAATSRLLASMTVQRQEYPSGGGEAGPSEAGVVNLVAGIVNVSGGIVNVSGRGPEGGGGPESGGPGGGGPGGGGPGGASAGGGGWGEEIPVPATGGV